MPNNTTDTPAATRGTDWQARALKAEAWIERWTHEGQCNVPSHRHEEEHSCVRIGMLHSCPWCGLAMKGWFWSRQMGHVIDCGDKRYAAQPTPAALTEEAVTREWNALRAEWSQGGTVTVPVNPIGPWWDREELDFEIAFARRIAALSAPSPDATGGTEP